MKMTISPDQIVLSGMYALDSIKGFSGQLSKEKELANIVDVSALVGAGAPLFALLVQVVKKSKRLEVVGASDELVDMAKLYGVDQVLTFRT
ncbi:hypothetical protein [Marinomonas mediterranea]|jgi:hypothetical protein|uniref:STAS domain-containing protein n=1 Tax=Marinomonas mediterranea (strain ATCC 700492 / JCM 21426 / NBRC 103028 / MMB-1) TaxID=717774 RepID=F2K1A9_MARM1|nr:hypothetical protein [Marinomonas mediterranea]ADZ91040.1 hypothetical protein Marme_1784 [Marinomonas mediterranea MMB-1]WCN09077.1 hypothetical protein GV055_09125 [Marinomonas mediterranea]WCN17179.1 hypothetical protein GV053_09020 [Marinomonas mediterranea MMB-1]